jgi:hypothetical protein
MTYKLTPVEKETVIIFNEEDERINIPEDKIHMTQEQFEREMNYRVAVSIAENLLIQGLITDREYHEIDTIMIEKYHPIFGGLCR